MDSYDIVIIGAGASGLQLAVALGEDPFFQNHSIALLEKNGQKTNDRTWCFWEKGSGAFDEITFRQWETIRLAGPDLNRSESLGDYRYKMIRAIDFYQAMDSRLERCPNIQRIACAVEKVKELPSEVRITTDAGILQTEQVFTSVFFDQDSDTVLPYAGGGHRHPLLLQHFLGWVIRTEAAVFDPNIPTFMDFDLPQLGNTRFMYVLPFSKNEALVEYTLFSAEMLKREAYEAGLKDYLKEKMGVADYEILEEETGCIPMTVSDFSAHNTQRIYHIGVAGGWAKPSTGYTFYRISQWVPRIAAALKANTSLPTPPKNRFWYYDRLLLDVLHRDNHMGAELFTGMFKKLSAELIMKFLGEESNLGEEWRVINSCPYGPFIRALLKSMVT